jgi:hypothetical protein
MTLNTIHISGHAWDRMDSREIDLKTLVQILKRGKMTQNGKNRHKVSLRRQVENDTVCYCAVLSEDDNMIITVWKKIIPGRDKKDTAFNSKMYKRRKSAICKRELESYYRDELLDYNIRCCA